MCLTPPLWIINPATSMYFQNISHSLQHCL
jgi:hypothetical protein